MCLQPKSDNRIHPNTMIFFILQRRTRRAFTLLYMSSAIFPHPEPASLLPYEDVDGAAMHAPVLANLVFKKAAVILFHVLWKVGIEHEGWNLRIGQLRTIFDFDVFSLDALWRKGFDDGQHHFVELRRSDVHLAVEIHLFCRFQNSEDALLGEG